MKTLTAFSLLELLITLSIIGLLSAIGYPSYQHHLHTVYRQKTRVQMHRIALQLERYYSQHHSYQGAVIPLQNKYYRFTLTVNKKHHYLLKAVPKIHHNNGLSGALTLNSIGRSELSSRIIYGSRIKVRDDKLKARVTNSKPG
ncbi:MAG: type IV pilin protein [Coxiellaceae bacterium]|nr:type IV pilin protein [Coxiellaceae bacterium]